MKETTTKTIARYILFRADASTNIGIGHIMRCLVVSKELDLYGIKSVYLTANVKGNLGDVITGLGYELEWVRDRNFKIVDPKSLTSEDDSCYSCQVASKYSAEGIVLDHYDLGYQWEKKVKANGLKLFTISDFPNRDFICDLLLDQTYNRHKNDYRSNVSETTRVLTGIDYCLLREEFDVDRDKLYESRLDKIPKKILVNFGGTDHLKITEKFVKALKGITISQSLEFKVIVGSGYPDVDSLISTIGQINSDTSFNVSLTVNEKNMVNALLDCDLAIGAGGTSNWERCALLLPVMIVSTADNQRDIANYLNDYGVALLVDKDEIENPVIIENALRRLLSKPFRNQSINRLHELNIGNKKHLFPFYIAESLGTVNVELRQLNSDDCDPIYRLQSEPGIRKYFRNSEVPSYKEHKKWFSERISSSSIDYSIRVADHLIGMIRLDMTANGDSYEVSIIISNKWQGLGLGKLALKQLILEGHANKIIAWVDSENTRSTRLFDACGFKQDSDPRVWVYASEEEVHQC